MWRSYKNIGNFEMAFHHYEEWNWMEDSLANQEVGLKYAELEKKYDLVKKENTIASLKTKEASSRLKYMVLLGILSLVALVLIIRKNRQIDKSKRALINSYKVAEYALYEGEKNERSRICLLYTSPSPRDQRGSRMPSSA